MGKRQIPGAVQRAQTGVKAFPRVTMDVDRGKLPVPAPAMNVNQVRRERCSRQEPDPILLRFCQRCGTTHCEAGVSGRSHCAPSALPFSDRSQAVSLLSLETIRAVFSHGAVVRKKLLACSCNALPVNVPGTLL